MLSQAVELADTEPDEALRLANLHLNENFDDARCLFLMGYIFLQAKRIGIAYALFQRVLQLDPMRVEAMDNLARCCQLADREGEALQLLRKSLSIKPGAVSYNNLGLSHLNMCDVSRAIEYCSKALEYRPNMPDALHNIGLANLHLKNWQKGWDGYQYNLGTDQDRKERIYGDEPRWDGTKGQTVVCYGEQGLGDEISFASCIPDLMRDCNVIIDCDKRLEGLFKRSFGCEVHGTRFETDLDWPAHHRIDARVSIGTLPKFYRNRTEDFPGTAYLRADPERCIQWRALLASFGDRPKIGIAWTGGVNNTGKKRRSRRLKDFLPILKKDATFISLEYRDASKEIAEFEAEYGIKVHSWERAKDIEELAAIVAECDLVISVTTAVVHLAGALGTPCYCFVPERPRWFYGLDGDTVPWYQSVKLFRNWPIEEVAKLVENIHRIR